MVDFNPDEIWQKLKNNKFALPALIIGAGIGLYVLITKKKDTSSGGTETSYGYENIDAGTGASSGTGSGSGSATDLQALFDGLAGTVQEGFNDLTTQFTDAMQAQTDSIADFLSEQQDYLSELLGSVTGGLPMGIPYAGEPMFEGGYADYSSGFDLSDAPLNITDPKGLNSQASFFDLSGQTGSKSSKGIAETFIDWLKPVNPNQSYDKYGDVSTQNYPLGKVNVRNAGSVLRNVMGDGFGLGGNVVSYRSQSKVNTPSLTTPKITAPTLNLSSSKSSSKGVTKSSKSSGSNTASAPSKPVSVPTVKPQSNVTSKPKVVTPAKTAPKPVKSASPLSKLK